MTSSSSSSSSTKSAWSKALTDAEARFKQLFGSPASEWKRVQGNNSDVSVHKHTREDVYRLVLDVPSSNSLSPFLSALTTPELRQEWDPAVIEASLLERDMDMDMRITKTNFTLGWPASPRDAVMISRTKLASDAVVDISTSLPRSADEPAYLRPSPPYVRSNVALLAWCIQQLGTKIRITCFSQHDLRLTMFSSSSTSATATQLSAMVLGLLRTTIKRANRIPKLVGYGSGVSLERVRFQIDREALTVEYLIVPGEGDEGVTDKDMATPSPPRAIECILPAGEGWDVQVTTRASEEEVQRLPWTATATKGSSYPQSNSLPNSSSTSVSPSPTTSSSFPLDQIHFRITHSPQTLDDHSVIKVKVDIEISAGGPSSSSSRGRERLRLNGVVQSIREPTIGMPRMGLYGNTQRARSMSIIPDAGDGSSLHGSVASSIAASSIASSSSTRLLGAVDTATPALGRGGRTPAAEKTILSRVKRNYIYFSSLLQEPEAKWRRTTESRGVTITQLDSIDPTLVVYRAEATFVGVGLWDMFGAVVAPGTSRGFVPSSASGRSGSTGGGLGSGNTGGNGDAVLLEDVNDLTELWYLKTRGVWPINGRDSVVLKTVYKSPTTIHVFAFSADDLAHLFPSLTSSPLDPNNPNLNSLNSNPNPPSNNPSNPSSSSNLIRTQVDLQGFSIEALSPNTTLLTLLEQSDPKGWISNTSTLPNQMINALAGIGEFAIKCGGPPVVTRLMGARKNWDGVRYDHERGVFRVEYESDLGRASASPTATTTTGTPASDKNTDGTSSTTTSPTIECEIRCDMDTWAHSLDIVIDPPPQSISCLRRHRLSDEGGGLWITVVHDAVSVAGFSGSPGSGSNDSFGSNTNTDDSRLQIIIRRGPGREKGLVMVNGAKAQVDVEELGEAEVRALGRRKRVKPPRIPLDQPPVLGVIRRRRGETGGAEGGGEGVSGSFSGSSVSPTSETGAGGAGTQPKSPSPLSRFFTYALDQATAVTISTQQTLASISPIPIPMPKPLSIQNSNSGSGSTLASIGVDSDAVYSSSSPSMAQKHSMQYALDALAWTQGYHCTMAAQAGWVLVSSDSGVPVHRKLVSSLSSYPSPSSLNPNYPSTSNSILTPIPIHRGTKVIEGISAEELAIVITEPGCRKIWDGKYFSEELGFEIFGGSSTDANTDTGGPGGGNLGKTSFVVGKVGGAGLGGLIPLMFRDRGFYVASVVARGQGIGMGMGMGTSRRGTMTEGVTTGLDDGSNGTGSRNALFIVSASFNPSLSSSPSSSSTQFPFPFSSSKYNPSSLPIGHIHIDAWILETLDPYTKENYAVPSTRVTRLIGVEYAGSVPGAVNGMINATMVKSGILGLEGYVKNSGMDTFSLPFLRLPAAGFVLGDRMEGDDDDDDDMNGKAASSRYGWSLRNRDEYRTLLKTGFDTAERTYVGMVLLRFPGPGGCDSEAAHSGKGSLSLSPSRHSSRQRQEQITPRASRVSLNTLPELELEEGSRSSNSSLDTLSGLPSLSSSSLTGTSPAPGFPSSPTSSSFSMSNMASPTSMLTTSTSSTISSMPGGHRDRERERTISGSGSNLTFRGRSSSTFTLKGQVRQNTDLLVGEIVIDSKLYPKGYVVLLRSKTIASKTMAATASTGKIKVRSGSVRGSSTSKSPSRAATRRGNKPHPKPKPIYLDSFFSCSESASSASANPNPSDLSETFISSHSDTDSNSGSEFQLPLQYTLHTMPSSPLHSSGMNIMNQPDNTSDSDYDYAPTRHLLRLTLPTAQYQILPAVEDPLTPPGETRQPPPKPKWLLEMEGEEGAMSAGAVVRVEVRPLDPSVSGSKGKGKVVVVVDGRKGPSKDKDKDGRVWNKDQRGWEVPVVGEKESLTALGREVLLDDRVSSMGVLSRTINELGQDADALPHDLRTAVAISDSLLDPDVMKDLEKQMSVGDGMDQSLDDGNGKENGGSSTDNNNGKETQSGVQAPEPNETPRPSLHTHLPGTRGMFLNFLNSYPNSLIGRFTVTSTADASSGEKHSKNGAVMGTKPNKVQMQNERPTGQVYPVSTLIIIALIAFLIGSLFRSLLSPADFIYVVQDIGEAEEAQVEGAGWREMRRLFEIKHILGGWDFQIAAVRRH